MVSMADAVEAASRSLEKPTPQRIDDLVDEIIAHKIADHQLDECHLTMNEIRAASRRHGRDGEKHDAHAYLVR